MKRSFGRVAITLGALGALALPALAGAQRPERRELPRADATRIINLRRQLDLTPRQLTQLDSIERATHEARRANAEAMRTRRDSMRPRNDSLVRNRMRAGGTPEARTAMRDSMRARMEAMRPQMEQMRRRDSTSRDAAERVLNDAQRQSLREIQAEERGRQRGMREARGARGSRGGQMRGGRAPGQMRGRPAMGGAAGMRARQGEVRARVQMPPR